MRDKFWDKKMVFGQNVGKFLGQIFGQNFGRNVRQIFAQNLGHELGQDLGHEFGQDLKPNCKQDFGQDVGQVSDKIKKIWDKISGLVCVRIGVRHVFEI